ncbi:MAG: exodeoxyribonuclease VII large subunit [Anaerolineae bacterium]|nr:MAG: exodeoxyribonuclease VII large subunit [Anaerolineae bacterium]
MPLFADPLSLYWTVTDLTRYLRRLLEDDEALRDLWVEGEVSNLSRPSSGHLYFTLKDAGAALRCVMWRRDVARLRPNLHDGMAVVVHGYISIYESGGQYQLYADFVRPLGEGALYQEFLRLKALLEAEGLFDAERKRSLPSLPKRIGVVTSPTGAALRDILNTLRRRFPLAEVILSPSPVQGDEAPPALVEALARLNALEPPPDVILLARGGGSIEDLWAFNDERVVRAVASSAVPVITGVGHETDFTLVDFAADLRAPTPTAAAELATPVTLADLALALQNLTARAETAVQRSLSRRREGLIALNDRMERASPLRRLQVERQRLDELARRGLAAMGHRLELYETRLEGMRERLISLDPMSVLKRGFSVLTRPSDGRVVSRVEQVSAGDVLRARVSDGTFAVRVTDGE